METAEKNRIHQAGRKREEQKMKKDCYEGILSFQGKWREYQARVLEESEEYLKDGKIHIVAAPGAGKTTLGIELIRRTGSPCLILSPRIVIRQQWLERIRESFLAEGKERDGFLSADLKEPGVITSVTYQTLYHGMKRMKGTADDGEGTAQEKEDFQGFSITDTLKKAGVKVICLDECHHLKNEWWKALESFLEEMQGMTVISLTATPPYDAAPTQWERYIRVCGPVDTEITIPELVREGSLCPHQDYVWLNLPSEEEESQIRAFQDRAYDVFCRLMEDQSMREAAASHPALQDYEGYHDRMLENPAYLSGLLIYCRSQGIPFPEKWIRVLCVRQLPEMNLRWMETFLQGFLFDDRDSFCCREEYRDALLRELKSGGLCEKKQVRLQTDPKLENLLVNSRGKLNSILQIASCEQTALGENLRMLILTDYVRKEWKTALGDPEREIGIMGVLPVFELLRRRGACQRLGVLCGSMILIPVSAEEAFTEEAERAGDSLHPEFRRLRDRQGRELGYSEVVIRGEINRYTGVVTRIFERGYIQILTGTKSLLGEGWDSPCINSLILASFVGSFVLGNQMRGRAVRKDPIHPDKVSNIWHLVCIPGKREQQERRNAGFEEPVLSEDFDTLERRMKGILGVSFDGAVIENGVERLGIPVRPDYTKSMVDRLNEETAKRSADRAGVAGQWQQPLILSGDPVTVDECTADRKAVRRGAVFVNTLGAQLLAFVMEGVNLLFRVRRFFGGMWDTRIFLVFTAVFVLVTLLCGRRLLHVLTPMRQFRSAAKGVLAALKKSGTVTERCRVETAEEKGVRFAAWLEDGTDREKAVFADAVTELLSPVDNQRYLLCRGRRGGRRTEYYCVPSVFAGTREKAELFRESMEPWIGRYHLVYTRNPEGRRILLEGRARAFSSANQKLLERKKRVKESKSPLE